MIVTLHVAGLQLLCSTSLYIPISTTFPLVASSNAYISSTLHIQSSFNMVHPKCIYNLKCAVSLHLYHQSLKIQHHSKATMLCMKMTVFPIISDQYTSSYDEIFTSSIFNSNRRLIFIKIYMISNAVYLCIYTSDSYKSNDIQKARLSARR